ncbi:MAG: glycosyltransferase family 39 protein [Candidatus Omnitrophica bacterium]|nr:glycosyltransferase family 39 protein [Candidatus Omnitrophota bacterium]
MTMKDARLIFVIIVGAFLVRLILLLPVLHITPGDVEGYGELAQNVLDGRGYSINGQATSCHPPLYPFFIASVLYSFNHNYSALIIIQILSGAVVCAVIFLISKDIFNTRVALISALIACFNPGFVKISQYLRNENLFTFLLVIAMFLLLRQLRKHTFRNLVVLGIVLGLAVMVRDMLVLFPLFILSLSGRAMFPKWYNIRQILAGVLIFVAFFLLPILPWIIRNSQLHHRFTLITNKTGMGLYGSYVPQNGKLFGLHPKDDTTKKADLLDSEAERSDFLAREALKYIRRNPLKVLKLELLKLGFFWSPFDWEIIGYGIYNFMYVFIMPFFIYGIFITRRRLKELLPVYLPVIYAVFITLIMYGSPRFRLPVEPYIIIIASAGIYYFVLRFSRRIYGVLLTGSYLLLNLFIYFNSYQAKIFARSFMEKIHLW